MDFFGLKPPSSVGGAYRRPKEPPGLPVQRLPALRYHQVQGSNETLYGLAQEWYGNPKDAQRIYNANRTGVIRDDSTPGFIENFNAVLPIGSLLLIP